MKNLTLAPMASYQSKIAGLIITAVALVLLLVVGVHGPFAFLSKPAADQQFNFVLLLIVFGLYLTAFSKEKHDDERVQLLRARSLQRAFMVMVSSIIAITANAILKNDPSIADFMMLVFMTGFGLSTYLVLFHIGLYFDPAVMYNDDTVMVNIRKNKTFFVFYTIGCVLFLLVIFLVFRK